MVIEIIFWYDKNENEYWNMIKIKKRELKTYKGKKKVLQFGKINKLNQNERNSRTNT